MKIMTKGEGKPIIGIIAGLHGDECIGKEVIELINWTPIEKGKIILIIANEEAIEKNKRFIDEDLNRCFPGNKNGNNEEKLANLIKSSLSKCDFVIDVHSTKCEMDDTIIITEDKAMELAKLVPITKIVRMEPIIAHNRALIDHVSCGVSIEFNEKTPANKIKDIVLKCLNNIFEKQEEKIDQEIYSVYGVIKKSEMYRDNLINFKEVNIFNESFYPLFFGGDEHEDLLCMKAKRIK